MQIKELNKALQFEPKFRLNQALKAIYEDSIDNWDQALVLPQILRNQLNEKAPLELDYEIFDSNDKKTKKALLKLNDGQLIETVLMKNRDERNTICISSQVGCSLGCTFCATGKMGFKRNLTVDEIIDQVLLWARILKKQKNQKIDNIVYMGMGEPFLNYENVIDSIDILKSYFKIGARRISVSTIGIPEKIKQFAIDEPQVNLAISLHFANDSKRDKYIPANKKWPIDLLLPLVDDYVEITKRKVMFEYVVMAGINDSANDLEMLVDLFKDKSWYVINLINYNNTELFKGVTRAKLTEIKEYLEDNNINISIRYSHGQDISAACGQLACKK